MKCYECPSYKKGRGTKRCLTCNEFKNINMFEQRYKPCVNYVKIPRIILESLSLDETESEIYNLLDPIDAIILFSKYHLNLNDITISKLLNISQKTVQRKKKYSLDKLTTYLLY
jgi:DNA-directed RNA polymerase specialized sigma subunit